MSSEIAFIERAIEQAINVRAHDIAIEEGDRAVERVRKRLSDEIDSIALSIAKQYEVAFDRSFVTIRVDRRALEEGRA